MLKYIFKNFDQFLETLRVKVLHLFSKKKSPYSSRIKLTPSDILEREIQKHEENLKEKKSLESKQEIRKNILYLRLKLKALNSANRYIKRAMDILRDRVEESAYEALSYLNRTPEDLERDEQIEIKTFKALIYELIEDFEAATKEYKELLKIDKSSATIIEYKGFVERSRVFVSWHSKGRAKLIENSHNIHNIVSLESMPKAAQRLESLAKYYARSPKSRSLGKSYYKEVLKMYKKLLANDPKEYTCAYINALLDGVELFMMSPALLKEAQNLLMDSRDCIDMRVFLLERIKELKQKSFIQKSLGHL